MVAMLPLFCFSCGDPIRDGHVAGHGVLLHAQRLSMAAMFPGPCGPPCGHCGALSLPLLPREAPRGPRGAPRGLLGGAPHGPRGAPWTFWSSWSASWSASRTLWSASRTLRSAQLTSELRPHEDPRGPRGPPRGLLGAPDGPRGAPRGPRGAHFQRFATPWDLIDDGHGAGRGVLLHAQRWSMVATFLCFCSAVA